MPLPQETSAADAENCGRAPESTDRKLRVGLIGASPTRGWAKISHVPALEHFPGFELSAVLGTDQAKADAAASAYGARIGYSDPSALFADPEIDLITVAVAVPDHRELVLGALTAGKHVYCEWPLGRTLSEAEEMAAAARDAKAKTAVGLQARCNPATIKAAELIADGAIGRVLGVRVLSTTMAWGPNVEAAMAMAEDPANAVNLITVQAMHTIDLAIAVVGGLTDIDALTGRQYPLVSVEGGVGPQDRRTFDHLLAHARLAAGGMLGVEVVGGAPVDDTPFRMEVTGEAGTLALVGGAPRGFQSGVLQLLRDGRPLPVDVTALNGLPDTAANVAAVYRALRSDILQDTRHAPDFDHAVRLTRMIDDVLASSSEGRRICADGWPT